MFKISKNMRVALLIFVVIIIISVNFNSVVEGLVTLTKISDGSLYTECRDASASCSTCINAQIQNTSSPCYWNSTPKPGSPNCSAFNDPGYSRTCNTPAPNNVCTANTSKVQCIQNGCTWNSSTGKCDTKLVPDPNCPQYSLLQSPVYVKSTN